MAVENHPQVEIEATGEIIVSIVCNAYNHEKYIRDALEGFVNQNTDFRYEILIHDDASTDCTAEIIREYQMNYPELFKPIYEKENIYSRHDGSLAKIQYGRAVGKYIAICEGDDYWIDPHKLQKQVNYLDNHPDVDMCAHQASIYDCRSRLITQAITPVNETRVLSVEEVIMGEGGFLATASLVFRRELLDDEPEFKKFWDIDYTKQIQGALRGGIYFIDEVMSVYRFMTEGSWSQKTYTSSIRQKQLFDKKSTMLGILDAETHGKYTNIIGYRQLKNEFEYYKSIGNYRKAIRKTYWVFVNELPLLDRSKLIIKGVFPFMTVFLRRLRGRGKNEYR